MQFYAKTETKSIKSYDFSDLNLMTLKWHLMSMEKFDKLFKGPQIHVDDKLTFGARFLTIAPVQYNYTIGLIPGTYVFHFCLSCDLT